MKNKDFVAFILTHGRPDRVHTFKTLRAQGYTGPIFLLIDNEDKAREAYEKEFGKQVIVFDKKGISDTFDEGDNFEDRRAIIYARNACFGIAKAMGFTYFIQLDDDYTRFDYRFDEELSYFAKGKKIGRLDDVFGVLLDYFKSIPAKSIAIAQGGDFIGGADGVNITAKRPRLLRKCMNTFICSTERPFTFVGRINEDVNTYTGHARRGDLFLTLNNVSVNQLQTQSNAGGMTDLYVNSGTYVKSFYSVMYAPSCVKIRQMGSVHKRLHHNVKWKNCAPKIIDESLRKP